MTAKNDPKINIAANQKTGMQRNKGGNKPSGEPASVPAAKAIESGTDRNKGKSAIIID